MNQDESEKLSQIHEDVRKTSTRVEVIDERTKSLDGRIDRMQQEIQKNRNDIDDLQGTVRTNKTILGGVGTGVSALLLWVADKVTRII